MSNRDGAAEATRYLISHGHTRVAFIGDDEHIYNAEKRLQGYSQAMKESGLEPEYRMARGTIPDAREIAAKLLVEGHGTTAFLGGNSLITAGILHALDDARVRIPEDAAVVGFDDFQFVSALRPSLTVVHQPTQQLGVKAARMLLERLNGSENEAPRREVLDTRLIVRGSCGCDVS